MSIGENQRSKSRSKSPDEHSENSKNLNVSVLDSSPDNFACGQSLMDSQASKSKNDMGVKVKTVGRKGQQFTKRLNDK